jgi:hypothetical protein
MRDMVLGGVMALGAVYCLVALLRFYSDVLVGLI